MKTHLLVSFLFFPAVLAAEEISDGEDSFPPKVKPLSAYEKLRAKSPFEFNIPKAPQKPAIDPFEGFSLAGYCGRGDTLTVYLLEGKDKKHVTVFGDGSPFKKRDKSGFRVAGIQRGRTLRETSIILVKNGQRGVLKFDAETLHSKSDPPPVTAGKIIKRPVKVPQPIGAANPPPPVYKAPEPFIPGLTPAPQNIKAPTGGNAQPQTRKGTPVPAPASVPVRRKIVLPTR